MANDRRRIRVTAPPDGGRATPPPRRRPQVVLPDDAPAPRAAASVFDEPGPLPRGIAAPDTSVTDAGSATASRPRHVRIPAPGDAPLGPPPDDRIREPHTTIRETADDVNPPTDPPETADGAGFPWKRVRRIALAVAAVFVLLIVAGLVWSYQKFNSIETIDLSEVLASENGTNYLIVGTDSRDGIDDDNPNAGAILGDDTVGQPQRSDTMMIVRIDGSGTHTLSVPRDLYVTIAGTGSHGKINAAFLGGPERLIATLADQLGLPIHHYLEIDLAAFEGMVDALGGITIDFPYPAYDNGSGLNIEEAGEHTLNGSEALAYVRARKYHQIIDGEDVPDGLGDLNRVVRQQQFLSAVGSKVGGTRNPFTLMSTADAIANGLRIDSDMSYFDALSLLRRLRNLDADPVALPVTFGQAGAAAIVNLLQPDADEVLADFGSPGASIT